jgi:hypothetical protein
MPLTMNRQPVTRLAVASLLLSTLAVTTARADETDTPTFTLSGFGTVGLAHSSEGQADFTNSPFVKKTGAGFSESWSANVDSVIGAQITANFTPQVSGVLQVISQLRFDGSYTPEVEWANLKYQFTPDFNVRVGRIGMPTLLVSDYRYVGYSTPWVRAPMDIYGLIPLTNNDGVDASYRIRIGNASSTFQASFGNSEIKNANGVSPTTIKRGVGLFNTTEIDRTTLHFAYQEADLSFPLLYPLADGFKQFGPAGVAIADKYLARDSRMKLMVIGAMYDADDWFVMAEVTPYITFAESEKTSNITDPGLNAANFPAYLAGSIATLNAGLNNSLRGASGHTLSLGSRWDFTRNTALKVQYDRVMLSANSAGTLTNLQPGYKRGESYNVFSIALNFVF